MLSIGTFNFFAVVFFICSVLFAQYFVVILKKEILLALLCITTAELYCSSSFLFKNFCRSSSIRQSSRRARSILRQKSQPNFVRRFSFAISVVARCYRDYIEPRFVKWNAGKNILRRRKFTIAFLVIEYFEDVHIFNFHLSMQKRPKVKKYYFDLAPRIA